MSLPPVALDAVGQHLEAFTSDAVDAVVLIDPEVGPHELRGFHAPCHSVRGAAGLPEVKFHDLRHAAGNQTRLLIGMR